VFPRFLAVHVLITASSQSLAPSTLLLLSRIRPVPYRERLPTAAKTNQEWITVQQKYCLSEFLQTSLEICTESLIKSSSDNCGK
jgi:hypothetical protein